MSCAMGEARPSLLVTSKQKILCRTQSVDRQTIPHSQQLVDSKTSPQQKLSKALHKQSLSSQYSRTSSKEVPKQNASQVKPEIKLHASLVSISSTSQHRFANVVPTATMPSSGTRRNTFSGMGKRERGSNCALDMQDAKIVSSASRNTKRHSEQLSRPDIQNSLSAPISCPELTGIPENNSDSDSSYGSSVGLKLPSHPSDDSPCSNVYSPNIIVPPNIFVTSFVSEKDMKTHKNPSKSKYLWRKASKTILSSASTPNIATPVAKNKHRPITKSKSDTAAKNERQPEYAMFLTQSASKQVKTKPHFVQLTDNLYVGNLECAYNEPLKCRLGIGSVVDLGNTDPDSVPLHKKSAIPCMCGRSPHPQAFLRLGMSLNSEKEHLIESFSKINRFIAGAHKNNKNALIVCYSGGCLSAVAGLQYLISMGEISFAGARTLANQTLQHVAIDGPTWTFLSHLATMHCTKHGDTVLSQNTKAISQQEINASNDAVKETNNKHINEHLFKEGNDKCANMDHSMYSESRKPSKPVLKKKKSEGYDRKAPRYAWCEGKTKTEA